MNSGTNSLSSRIARHSFWAMACLFHGCGFETSEFDSQVAKSHQESDLIDALTFSTSLADSPNGAYIVNFRGDAQTLPQPSAGHFAETRHFHGWLSSTFLSDRRVVTLDFLHAVDFKKVMGDHQFAAEFGTPTFLKRSLGAYAENPTVGIMAKVNFQAEADARSALNEWYERGLVWYAEPDYRSSAEQGSFDGYIQRYNKLKDDNVTCQSNSGTYSTTTWLDQINLSGAFQFLKQQQSALETPIIAVMDSGVDFSHEMLSGRKWDNKRVGFRDCKEDFHGCNTTVGSRGLLGDGDIQPFGLQSDGTCPGDRYSCDRNCCHGTHVAGIVAAFSETNSLTMGGVCPMCEIMAIRVVGKVPGESGSTILDSSIIRGLKYVSAFSSGEGFGVRIVNASFGKFQRSRSVALIIRHLRESKNGVLVIGAAGNEDSMKPNYPAGYNDAIAVSNIHSDGGKHVASNFGRWVDVAGPGGNICSTVPGNLIQEKSGTSMAAPVVAGVAGLLLALNPSLSYNDLRSRLILTANPSLYDNPTNKHYIPKIAGETASIPLLGTGMIDAEKALKESYSNHLPIVRAHDRVTTSCGQIGKGAYVGSKWLFFFIPTFILMIMRRREVKR